MNQWNRDYGKWDSERKRRTFVQPSTETDLLRVRRRKSGQSQIVQAPATAYYGTLQRAIARVREIDQWDQGHDPQYRIWPGLTYPREEMSNPDGVGWNVVYQYQSAREENSTPGQTALGTSAASTWLTQPSAGELVIDLVDILCHHWTMRSRPDGFHITDEMLWKYRGKSEWTAAELQKQQAAMREAQRFRFSRPGVGDDLHALMKWQMIPVGKNTGAVP